MPSYVHRRGLKIAVEGLDGVTGDVAWGGNWFFLIDNAPCATHAAHIPELTDAALGDKAELARAGRRGRTAAKSIISNFLTTARQAAPTVATSFSVRAALTIVRPAARGRAPSSPAWRPRARSRLARRG